MNQYALDGKMWWAGLYSTEVGKVQRKSGTHPCIPLRWLPHPKVYTTSGGRQGILESLQFLRSKFI